jgi:hypothetical protein
MSMGILSQDFGGNNPKVVFSVNNFCAPDISETFTRIVQKVRGDRVKSHQDNCQYL